MTRAMVRHGYSPSSTQTRFCCRHGPEVAWANGSRLACPDAMRLAPRRCGSAPPPSSVFAHSGPPDGLIAHESPRPARRAGSSSWCVKGACSSATSTPPARRPPSRRRAGSTPTDARSRSSGLVRLDAVVDAADPGGPLAAGPARQVVGGQDDRGGAPSETGGQSCRRRAATGHVRARRAARRRRSRPSRSWANVVLPRRAGCATATSAISRSVCAPPRAARGPGGPPG